MINKTSKRNKINFLGRRAGALNFGKLMKKLRERKGWSQQALAAYLGIHGPAHTVQQRISALENTNPETSYVEKQWEMFLKVLPLAIEEGLIEKFGHESANKDRAAFDIKQRFRRVPKSKKLRVFEQMLDEIISLSASSPSPSERTSSNSSGGQPRDILDAPQPVGAASSVAPSTGHTAPSLRKTKKRE